MDVIIVFYLFAELHARNVSASDVTHVICTHGHIDHIGVYLCIFMIKLFYRQFVTLYKRANLIGRRLGTQEWGVCES
jgi:hypothetical protein